MVNDRNDTFGAKATRGGGGPRDGLEPGAPKNAQFGTLGLKVTVNDKIVTNEVCIMRNIVSRLRFLMFMNLKDSILTFLIFSRDDGFRAVLGDGESGGKSTMQSGSGGIRCRKKFFKLEMGEQQH